MESYQESYQFQSRGDSRTATSSGEGSEGKLTRRMIVHGLDQGHWIIGSHRGKR